MSLLEFIAWLIGLYTTVVFIYVAMRWLIDLGIVDRRNHIVQAIAEALFRLVEPVLRPIRRRMPNLGPLDLSPLVLLFILILIKEVLIQHYLMRYFPF